MSRSTAAKVIADSTNTSPLCQNGVIAVIAELLRLPHVVPCGLKPLHEIAAAGKATS